MHGDPVNLKTAVERIVLFCIRVPDIPGLIITVPHTAVPLYVKQFKLSRICSINFKIDKLFKTLQIRNCVMFYSVHGDVIYGDAKIDYSALKMREDVGSMRP